MLIPTTLVQQDIGGPGNEFVFNSLLADTRTITAGGARPVVLAHAQTMDPQDWLGEGEYASPDWWGATFPEGSWLSLPEGVYQAEVAFAWADDPVTTQVWFADIDNRFADNVTDPWMSFSVNPLHFPVPSAALGSGVASGWRTCFRVQRTGAPWIWGMVARQESGGPLDLVSCSLSIMRISPGGG